MPAALKPGLELAFEEGASAPFTLSQFAGLPKNPRKPVAQRGGQSGAERYLHVNTRRKRD